MDLQQEIDARRAEIITDSYIMSVGELISLYQDREMDIHPAFQRFYRWDIWQKSRFIESLLLGIRAPQISVSIKEDGAWDVIDGLQRLSTLFELMGILKDEKGNLKPPLVLEGTKYLPCSDIDTHMCAASCDMRQNSLFLLHRPKPERRALRSASGFGLTRSPQAVLRRA